MATFRVLFGNGYRDHIYMDYNKEQVIRKVKEDAKRKGVSSFYIAYVGRNGTILGGKSVGEWELRGSRWFRV